MKLNDNGIFLTDGVYEGEHIHKYISLNDGSEYSGITGNDLLSQLFPLDIPEEKMHFVHEAAKRGSLIHDAIERWLKYGEESLTHMAFVKEYEKLALKESIAQEYCVNWRKFASNIDNVWQEGARSVSLVDYKSWKTKTHKNLIKTWWQLNIYKFMFENNNPTIKVKHLYCMWLPSDLECGKRGELIELPFIDEDIISTLMEDADCGRPLKVPELELDSIDVVGQRDLMTQEQINMIADTKIMADEASANYKKLTETLKAAMAEYGVKSIDNARFKASYSVSQKSVLDLNGLTEKYPHQVAECMTQFDEKLFKERYPDLYEEFVTKVDGAERLTITIKKKK